MSHTVIHADGTREAFQIAKLIGAITTLVNAVTSGEEAGVALFRIMKNVELKLPDEVTTNELDNIILKATESLISSDPLYDRIATAQLVAIVNRGVEQKFTSFQDYINFAVSEDILHKDLLSFNFMQLEQAFLPQNDYLFNFFGLSTVRDRYLTKDRQRNIIEKPQWMWMRIAMGLSLCETDREEFAIKVYQKLSGMYYIHATPTLFNSGTPYSQLSSCYINVVGDSMDSIMDKVNETAQFAKYAGGVGTSVTKLRASGSTVRSINAKSSGPIPFIKIFDATINGVVQGGRRRAGQVMYMEPRHYNIYEFLDLKETNGSPYLRTPSLNTAMWLSDNFMERVESGQDRRLFDPHECPELTESRGDEFTRHYDSYCDKAERGEIQCCRKIKARELYDRILFQLAKTGNYWINFKDTHNRYNQAPSYSLIHSSNLCTEISIPNREDSTAVCTLATLCLMSYVDKKTIRETAMNTLSFEQKMNLINRDVLTETIQIAVRALDNAMTINFYPSEASKKNTHDLRPIGLGLLGVADLYVWLGIPYDSADAVRAIDYIGKFVYAEALRTSQELAEHRGAFGDYDSERYDYAPRRNALLMSIQPTATTSLIVGQSSMIDAYFANVYSRETMSGKFTIINELLVEQCKKLDIWSEQLKNAIIANNGSVLGIPELEEKIDTSVFKTAYEFGWKAQIDVAAALQKHVDQAISRNMYIDESQRSQMYDVYMYAWKKGLKGTYYCFIEKKLQGEKYTQTVNKSAGRAGFGAKTSSEEVASEEVKTTGEGSTAAPTGKGFGARGFGAPATTAQATTDLSDIDLKNASDEDKAKIREMLIAKKGADYVAKLESGELYANGACPIDPFEKVMCTSCQ